MPKITVIPSIYNPETRMLNETVVKRRVAAYARVSTDYMLFVFEAPIDMLSFISMNPNSGWENDSYIAMNGVYESAVLTALEEHPNIDWVVICTDNDEGGIDAAHRLWDILGERG